MYLLKNEHYYERIKLLAELEILNNLNKDFDSLNEFHKDIIKQKKLECSAKISENPYLRLVSDIKFVLNDIQNNPKIQEALKIKENFILE